MSDAAPAPPGETLSARDAAKHETRRALLAAARSAFAEEGLLGPSLDAICARAGFTRGAFYVHFRSRDELVAAVMEETLESLLDGVVDTRGAGADLWAAIDRFVNVALWLRSPAGVAARQTQGIPFHQVLEACRRSPRLARLFARVLREAQNRLERAVTTAGRDGAIAREVAPRAVSSLLVLLALGLVVAQELDMDFDLPAARDALRALLVRT